MATSVTSTTYESLGYNSPEGMQIGTATTDKVAFYGSVPVVQRAASAGLHEASALSISSNTTIAASLVAWILETTATLKALGIWA
jgi:hypothetical protein